MKSTCPTPWLGAPHGYLSDYITQRWVQLTGRYIDLEETEWLQGPIGRATGIGSDFFDEYASETGLSIRKNQPGSGLLPDFRELAGPAFAAAETQPGVIDFYEHTADYALDAWGEWCGAFRPFGRMLAFLFSRRLQQLNVPLSSLDTSLGMTSDILQLFDEASGQTHYTAWVRRIVRTGHVLYAGSYSVCRVPGYDGPCIKVVFPLPNGSAIVIMKPELQADGSFLLTSSGERFGDPGFYFVVKNASGKISSRYVRAMRETIHVYATEDTIIRADHNLKLFGMMFLRLHYKLGKKVCLPILGK